MLSLCPYRNLRSHYYTFLMARHHSSPPRRDPFPRRLADSTADVVSAVNQLDGPRPDLSSTHTQSRASPPSPRPPSPLSPALRGPDSGAAIARDASHCTRPARSPRESAQYTAVVTPSLPSQPVIARHPIFCAPRPFFIIGDLTAQTPTAFADDNRLHTLRYH